MRNIYEIINKGKGVIDAITPLNLLRIKDDSLQNNIPLKLDILSTDFSPNDIDGFTLYFNALNPSLNILETTSIVQFLCTDTNDIYQLAGVGKGLYGLSNLQITSSNVLKFSLSGGAQNLQQVTDIGNTITDGTYTTQLNAGIISLGGTTSDSSINTDAFIISDADGSVMDIRKNEIGFYQSTNSLKLKSATLSGNRIATFPDRSITVAGTDELPDISGKMDKSVYDTDDSGVVDNAEKMTTIGRNATASILYKGTIVYISGSTGNRPNFVKAKADAESTSSGTFGVCIEDIAINSDGRVATIGTLSDLDTRTTATHPFTTDTLADGDTLYLSPSNAGYVTNVKPSAPNHLVYVGKVVRTSPTLGTIVYRMQNGYELDEIHDVAISSVANNEVLQYESASGLWKNKALTTASVSDSTNKRYVTDAQSAVIGNTSGTNSGDNATNSQYSGLDSKINQGVALSIFFTAISPTDATNYFASLSAQTLSTTESNRKFKMPYATTFRTVSICMTQSVASTSESVSVYIRNYTAGTETLIGTFVSNFTGNTTFNFTGLSVAIPNTTDEWNIKLACPTWTTNPTSWSGTITVIAF